MVDLKVQTKRNNARDEKRNQGRNLEKPKEEMKMKENQGTGQRMSRLDQLEQFRKEKREAMEKQRNKKQLVPFR